jgi:Holliday junction DNA helicase RuvA
MIASLQGQIKAVKDNRLVVEVGGVGYAVNVLGSFLEGVHRVGQTVELYTHLYVRETQLALYGFRTAEEQELFGTLLGVSGIGPRTAMAVLDTFSPETLRAAISQGDASTLTRIPGIGRKTAERLLLDLKDRIGVALEAVAAQGLGQADVDVMNALTALGYSLAEARSALQAVPEEAEALDERILAALQFLGST